MYCQRSVDSLDLAKRCLATNSLDDILRVLPAWLSGKLVERDFRTEQKLAETGQSRQINIGTCSGVLTQKDLIQDLRSIMGTLQGEYANPVDIEFTVNWSAGGEYLINLLQCRPLQTFALPGSAPETTLDAETIASFPPSDIFFALYKNTMGPQLCCRLDALIIIDPLAYYTLPYRDKPTVARTVGLLNARYKDTGKTVLLLAPGRIGTTSPELGIPVSFAEIDQIKILCEVAYSKAGYQPELSFGSHFFQDLVESGIFYAAIPENDHPSVFNPEFFDGSDNLMSGILPDSPLPDGLVRVYEGGNIFFYSDIVRGSCLCARIPEKPAGSA
jgi:pyruvate,water dikinase